MSQRIFVSSTCYDLIDIRAEVEQEILRMGMQPVLSDSMTSDFQTALPEAHSIETCLANVRSATSFLLILDQRYGPRLNAVGLGPYSATHLEYKEAIAHGLPTHVYVRDRLEGEFTFWKANGKKHDKGFKWVAEDQVGIFELLDEHRGLKTAVESRRQNWISVFRHSIDVKQLLVRDFRHIALRDKFQAAIESGEIPTFHCHCEHRLTANGHECVCQLENIGKTPAFNVKLWFGDKNESELSEVAYSPPAHRMEKVAFPQTSKVDYQQVLHVSYLTAAGQMIEDAFDLTVKFAHGGARASCRPTTKRFIARREALSVFTIEEQ